MQELKSELKKIFTTYWHFLALQKTCVLGVFDFLENQAKNIAQIAAGLNLNPIALESLLGFLVENQYLNLSNDHYFLTPKGEMLTENHPESMKNACILWGYEHLTAWQNLDYTLQTGKSSFEKLYGIPFFEYLNTDFEKLRNYHLAIRDYAKEDYKNIAQIIDFSIHQSVVDIGGGLGTLIGFIARQNPNTNCILFDLHSVTQLLNPENQIFKIYSGSFFEPLPFQVDAIVLSKILHDWNDEKALQILQNCRKALLPNGKLYIIEVLQNQLKAHLLSLNMMIMCESFERKIDEFEILLQQSDFKLLTVKKLNNHRSILICQ